MDGFRHIIPITVRFRDLDAFGHVNNAVILTYFETARVRYLFDLGINLPVDNWQELGVILAHISCDFRVPILYGQKVEVGTRAAQINRSSFKLEHRLEADGQLAAEGVDILVHFNYAAQRSQPLSAEFRAKIQAFEGRDF